MTELDPRYVYWAGYGVGLLVVYGLLLRRKVRHYQRHHDRRAFRDALFFTGLFLVALSAAAAITWALFGPKGTNIGSILSAVAAAVFLVVGIYALFDPEPDNGNTEARRQ